MKSSHSRQGERERQAGLRMEAGSSAVLEDVRERRVWGRAAGRLMTWHGLAILFLGFSIFYFGIGVNPVLRQEASGWLWFTETGLRQGGWLEPGRGGRWVAVWLSQWDGAVWSGAWLMTLAMAAVLWASRGLAVRLLLSEAVSFGPGFILLWLGTRYGFFWWGLVVEWLLAVGTFLVWRIYCQANARWRIGIGLLAAGGVWILGGVGPGLVLAGLMMWQAASRSGWLEVMGWAFVAGGIGWLELAVVGQTSWEAMNSWGRGMHFASSAAVFIVLPLFGVMRLCFQWLDGMRATFGWAKGLSVRRARHGLRVADGAVFILIGAALVLAVDSERRTRLEIDYAAGQQEWGGVLRAASRLPVWTSAIRLQVCRALFHTGRLGDDFFSFHQMSGDDLLPGLEAGLGVCGPLSATLLELGQVNLAEHFAQEALEVEGNRPGTLLVLARVNWLKNRPKAAAVFLNVLARHPGFYWEAAGMLEAMEHGSVRVADRVLRVTRAHLVGTDEPEGKPGSEAILWQLLRGEKRNRMAYEYWLMQQLLSRRLDRFAKELQHWGKGERLPRHFQEAWLVWERESEATNSQGGPTSIDRAIRDRFDRFERGLEAQRAGGDAAAKADLARLYGDSYWFYYVSERR